MVSEQGNQFVHSHANKGARQYRYYVEQKSGTGSCHPETDNEGKQPTVRLPAREIELAALAVRAAVQN